jgi:hypothetical protein
MQVVVNPKMTVSIPEVYAVSPGGQANTIYMGYGPPSVTLSVNAGGGTPGYSYSWSTGSSSPSITVNPSVPGSYVYTVTVTDSKGCQVTTSKTIMVTDARCGNKMEKVVVCHNGHEICISSNAVDAHLQHGDALGYCNTEILVRAQAKQEEEISVQTLKVDISPNPTSNEFKMVIQSKNDDLLNVTVTDNLGRNVFTTSKIPANKILVFGRNFRPGSYFVVVQQGKEVRSFKLIKLSE